jgi:tetratricopeptide (TPR) repeat protein
MKRSNLLSPFMLAAVPLLSGQGMGLPPLKHLMDSEVVSEHPDALRGATELQALIRQKRWDEAGILAEAAVREKPDSGSLWYALGLVRFNEHRYTQSLRALRHAELLNTSSAEVHRLLGLCYYFLQQYQLFEQQMAKAKSAEPRNGEFDYLLGRYYHLILGDCTRAIPAFDQAISLHFSGFKVLYNRGDCHDQNGELDRAEKDYLSAIEQIRPSATRESWPFQALARICLRTGRVNEATSLAREAVQIEDSSAENHILFAKALTESEEVPAAITELRRALELSPSDERVRYQLYRLYLKLGDHAAAQRELDTFRKLTGAEDTFHNSR